MSEVVNEWRGVCGVSACMKVHGEVMLVERVQDTPFVARRLRQLFMQVPFE